ncbi:MAG: hypothetical protein M3O50_12075, partial [Myxococcota bacterium]|nr:hypothetical protein [Myxococcota bacterium]
MRAFEIVPSRAASSVLAYSVLAVLAVGLLGTACSHHDGLPPPPPFQVGTTTADAQLPPAPR